MKETLNRSCQCSGKARVKHSRIESFKSNTTTYANNSSVQSFSSRVDDCIRTRQFGKQYAAELSYLWRVENDMKSTGFAYSGRSSFSSKVDSDIRSSHHSRISNSYPSYESMVDNDTITAVSSVSGSSLRTAPSWSTRLDSDIRSSSSYRYY
ncbi:hypothetical protein ACSQ67_005880 [Phaseolus vulgaris]